MAPSTDSSLTQALPDRLPTGVSPELVVEDSIRAMNKPIRDSSLSLIVVVIVFSIALLSHHAWKPVLAWAGAVLAIQFIPALLFMMLVPRDAQGRRPMLALRIYYWVAAASTGLFWGCSVLWFTDPAQPEIQFYIALTLGGIAATNMATLAFYPAMMRSYLVLLVGPFVLWGLWQDAFLYKYLGAGMGLLLSYLIYFGYFHTRTLHRTIELKHANQQLVKQLQSRTAELEAANQAKARFFAAASHDLRQPLHAMGYYTSLLKPHEQDAPHVERIAQCVESLDGLLEGVLSISRLDAGKVQRHITAVDLQELLARLRTLYEGVAQAKGLQLRLRLPKQAVWVQTDPVLLERVLGNLLSNALRYTERGGVLLAVRPIPLGSIWQVQVVDTGPGIEAGQLEHIFDEFVQLNNPQRDPNQGVGLGLATVKRICALLEHPLAVRSWVGQGSCFAVSLPVGQAPAPAASQPTQANTQMQGRVLMVEDNELVREALLHTLQSWGLQCTACASGDEALALLQDGTVWDVVISDWRLPGASHGLQVLAKARQAGVARLFLMTGETDEVLGELPADVQLLPKPLRPLRLRALLAAQ
ncbi:MAG: hybrid sensor histidine kinase/response regulator [Brachymonas sp.]